MSTWTQEEHEHARRQLAKHGRTWTILDFELSDEENEFISEAPDLLADALVEIERLRALPTITDDKVEKAAEALVYTMGQESDGACWISEWEGWTVIDGTFDMPSAVCAALEAALKTKENEA